MPNDTTRGSIQTVPNSIEPVRAAPSRAVPPPRPPHAPTYPCGLNAAAGPNPAEPSRAVPSRGHGRRFFVWELRVTWSQSARLVGCGAPGSARPPRTARPGPARPGALPFVPALRSFRGQRRTALQPGRGVARGGRLSHACPRKAACPQMHPPQRHPGVTPGASESHQTHKRPLRVPTASS